jgi:putative SOS response-associated peptidase YedK
MPVILDPESHQMWLDPGEPNVNDLQDLLRPFPESKMARCEFTRELNNSKNKDETKLMPIRPVETSPRP